MRRLGTLQEIRERVGVMDAWAWIKSELELENACENEGERKVSVSFYPDKIMEKDKRRLYHYTRDILGRDTSVIYYDRTNFFFESIKETELRRPGASKENRRTPIVQFGIFMDADGLSLAFCINPGNTNEQTALAPL